MYNKLLNDLKRDEGFRSHVYKDSEGHDTIGYGCLLSNGISEKAATELLYVQMIEHLEELKKWMEKQGMLLHSYPEPVRVALGNMAFNLGIPRLSKFKKMWAAIKKEDYVEASKEALDSVWAKQVGERAIRISKLFLEVVQFK